MEKLTQKFTAHPVGQGLFYSGMVDIEGRRYSDSSSFRFVFDCGSLNKGNADEEVNHYRNTVLKEDNFLDLLIISHFDADHVSHIKKLLENRKVKNVVLPFTTLEERLFLVLKHYYDTEGDLIPSDDDFPIEFMLDPIGSLGNNLDGDSTIYMVNSNPDKSFDGPGDVNNNESGLAENDNNKLRFYIKIDDINENRIDLFKFSNHGNAKLKIFNDSEKATLRFSNSTKVLMEFLFYRKNVGPNDEKFFEALFKAFCIKYKLSTTDPSEMNIDELINKVKDIKNAGPIKELISLIKDSFILSVSDTEIKNLNTTALCMLHYNLPDIYILDRSGPYWIEREVKSIQKFDGTNNTRIEDMYDCIFPYVSLHSPKRFPNCLLTSDCFLKTTEDVHAFYNKYQQYWNLIWLFQIPHHGAASSAGLNLLNHLPYRLTKFINYGTTHMFIKRWQHPSPQLISDLVASGQSTHLLPVNEFAGFEYGINYIY